MIEYIGSMVGADIAIKKVKFSLAEISIAFF